MNNNRFNKLLNAIYLLLIAVGLIGTGLIFILFESGSSFRQDVVVTFVSSPLKEILGLITIVVGIVFGWKGIVEFKERN